MMQRIFQHCLLLLIFIHAPLAVAKVYVVQDGESIQDTVKKMSAGDTIKIMPGVYHESIFIDKDNISVIGVVKEGRWPVLDGKNKLYDGVLVGGHGAVIESLWVKGYKGNAIMIQGGNNYRITHNVVEGPAFYGIFPQFGKNGLVAYNSLSGVSDSSIYIGMSENVDVIHNDTYGSVLGIETENSTNILVEGNNVYGNSTGIVINLIPGLPIKSSNDVIVRNNFISANNLKNFADPGSVAASVPTGVGIWNWAVDGATIEGNIIKDNNSAGIVWADHSFIAASAISTAPDLKMDPRPDRGKILRNLYLNNGSKPATVLRDVLATAGFDKGVDVLATGKGRKNCLAERESIVDVGTKGWTECKTGETSEHIVSYQLEEPVPSPSFTPEQMGRLTYLTVCTGCHSYTTSIIGPPMQIIQAKYKSDPDGLIKYIKSPTDNWPQYGDMPPQDYLTEETLSQVVDYILNKLEK